MHDDGPFIIDYQNGAMATANQAGDFCTIDVIANATFSELTFAWNYDTARTPLPDRTAIGTVAPDTVTSGVTFTATQIIYGVKSYKLATGTIIARHRKN